MEDKNIITYNLNIEGMTCINCQNHIEEALMATNGIVEAKVDYKKGTAVVVCDETITRAQICSIVSDCGYRVVAPNTEARKKLLFAGIVLLVIVLVYFLLSTFGVLNLLVPSQLADSSILDGGSIREIILGYGMLFVIGLLTSVHCIAMCGGINLSQCLPTETQGEKSTKAAILPSFFYNLGRVISYTVIGFIMGLIGFAIGGGKSDVGMPLILQGILKLIAGIFMVIMGLNMLGIFPWLRKITPHMPAFLAKKINAQKRKGASSFLVGILNGIMPCGPLQSMWIVALATGNPFAGALSMLLFALGTVPLMLGLGSLVAKLGQKFSKTVMLVGSVLVVIMGLAMLSQGGGLTGWLSPEALLVLIVALLLCGFLLIIPLQNKASRVALRSATAVITAAAILVCVFQNSIFFKTTGDVAVIDGDVQVVTSTLQSGDYPDITVQEGIPVKWIINAPDGSINGCNYEITIQEYGIIYTFHAGENIIEFTPTKTGSISYCCWMGMIYGTINVVEKLNT